MKKDHPFDIIGLISRLKLHYRLLIGNARRNLDTYLLFVYFLRLLINFACQRNGADGLSIKSNREHDMPEKFNRRAFVAGSTVVVAGTAVTVGTTPTATAQEVAQGAAGSNTPAAVGAERCPVMHGTNSYKASGNFANLHWWPNQLNLKLLSQNGPTTSPMAQTYN